MNRLFSKYYVGLDIQGTYIAVVIGQYTRRRFSLISSECIELSEPILINGQITDESLLVQKLARIRGHLPRNSLCRIALAESQILQQTLTLPVATLSSRDKQWFVTAALGRLFPLPANELAIDYPESGCELVITAARKKYIQQWQQIFIQAGLTLEKVSTQLTYDEHLQLAQPFRTAELLVRYSSRQGINLLPWRDNQRHWFYRRTIYLSVFYLALLVMGLMGWWWLADKKQQQIDQQVEQYTLASEQLHEQLINIISLNQQVNKIKDDVKQQKIPFCNLLILLKNLNFLTGAVSQGLWLEQLQFDNQTLVLKGNSFLYPAIMAFMERFEAQDFIQASQLQAIRYQADVLKFHVKIRLSADVEGSLDDK